MNRPWMPLYVADYRADTAHLSTAEHGAYLLLIMHYWSNGSLPDDDRQLARIVCMTPREWKQARPIVQAFFTDGWKHGRIEFELTEAARISAAGKAGGQASGRARRGRSQTRSANDPPTTDERSFNDQPNDLATKREALPSPSQPQSQKEEGKEESRACALAFPFDPFWQKFPNKVGKRDAEKAFDRVRKSGAVTFEALMIGLDRYVHKTDDRPWCNPATWLNQGRWDDQPATVESHDRQRSVLAAADRAIEQFGGPDAARAYVPGSEGPKPLSLDFSPGQTGVRLISKG